MVIFLFLMFQIFPVSFQTIPAILFCDDIVTEVFVVEGTQEIKIADRGIEGTGHNNHLFTYDSLNAVSGDLIKFTCSNSGGGYSLGGGCFVLDNKCYCDEFENDKPHLSENPHSRIFMYQVAIAPHFIAEVP